MTIFFDLDGPILDVSEKYYRVYNEILRKKGFQVLTKEKYWDAKRNKLPEEKILSLTDVRINYNDYRDKRITLIETERYLKYDILQHNAEKVLEALTKKFKLVLVTLRRSKHQLYKELKYFQIYQHFSDILSSGIQIKPRWKIKHDLIVQYMEQGENNNHILIGDTETDIESGKHLGFTTISITNGIRNEKILGYSNPDHMYSSISTFYDDYGSKKIS